MRRLCADTRFVSRRRYYLYKDFLQRHVEPLTPFDLPEALKRRSKKARIHKNKRIFGRSIDERAEVAASREEIGHWEIDTVVGKKFGSESVVLTIVEKVQTSI